MFNAPTFASASIPGVFSGERIHPGSIFSPVTRSRAVLHALHLASTFACNVVGVNTLREAGSRAGSLALLHVTPLFFGQQFSLAAELLGVSLKAYRLLHKAFGIMAVVQSTLHVIISGWDRVFDLGDRAFRYGFVAAVALAVLFVIVQPWIRSLAYDLYIPSHILLSIATLIMVWLHLGQPINFRELHAICMILAAGLFSGTTALHIVRIVLRNMPSPLAIADVIRKDGAVELTFRPPRAWKVRPGQHVYLRVPAVSFWSFTQSHPFNIIWSEDGPNGTSVSVIAKVESGFTRALAGGSHRRLRVIVDGPYESLGMDLWEDMYSYDAVVLFATGIGITGQLLYVRELLRRFISEQKAMTERGGGVRKHRISVVWEVEEQLGREIIQKDSEACGEGKPTDRSGKRAARVANQDACDRAAVRDEIRDITISEKRLHFQELAFQPSEDSAGYWAPQRALL
ncbi:predicted protein [Histoplasma mississippiense (nom. inval.)]|uniref:predicted protein n=1 Tax=Ajellomyces capsulatus (strain NAm1 / WU24) TaxID=2059318 RepID=UPI000157B933|nr:predicted protein [Histoplasma mississippiense (nom. inval.)]EDN03776.1 predicted protein [Histoplasma mississippiense (nom. inval.)]